MALACISGWPDAPDSPVHSRGAWLGGATGACGVVDPVVPAAARTANAGRAAPATAAATAIATSAAAPASVVLRGSLSIGTCRNLALLLACTMGNIYGCSFVNEAASQRRVNASPSAHFFPVASVRNMTPIRKAVFPVAGLGTRFLPATKAMPKEMLPVVDRPLIQHVVDEARQAGIEHFIFVTGRNKGVIEDHFDRQFELEMTLPGAPAQGRSGPAGEGVARSWHHELHPPAGAARAWPRGLVRARAGRRRAVRAACCPTCWCNTSAAASRR